MPAREVDIVLEAIVRHACWAAVLPAHTIRDLPDPDDAPFAECAAALACALVTGNARHYPTSAIGNLTLLTPRLFVDRLASG